MIDIDVKLVDVAVDRAGPGQNLSFGRLPKTVRIQYNKTRMELPSGFAEIFLDASRILPLRDQTLCGFLVERGDASTSNRIAVFFGEKRIRKIERYDLKGRTVSTTTFNYPGPVILD